MTAQEILNTTFSSRDEYLAWRTEWRAIYAEISKNIRTLRLVHKDECRNPVKDWKIGDGTWKNGERRRTWTPDEARRQKEVQTICERIIEAYRNGHKNLSALAHALMDRRKWSKLEAQRQYLAARALLAA